MSKVISYKELGALMEVKSEGNLFVSLSFNKKSEELFRKSPGAQKAKKQDVRTETAVIQVSMLREDAVETWKHTALLFSGHPTDLDKEEVKNDRDTKVYAMTSWYEVIKVYLKGEGRHIVEGKISTGEEVEDGRLDAQLLDESRQRFLTEMKERAQKKKQEETGAGVAESDDSGASVEE